MQSPRKQLFSFVYETIKLANMIGKSVKLASHHRLRDHKNPFDFGAALECYCLCKSVKKAK